MTKLAETGAMPEPHPQPFAIRSPKWITYIIARNPFYLISAGLLLYGINQLTTDPRLVGAEHSMLRFNFCALFAYEIMLVVTAIALARRAIWYEALLLVGMGNLFVIVPFSLISNAVYLDARLAGAMIFSGVLLTVGKFWAFKRYIPDLALPSRLLALGSLLLLTNAAGPLLFKVIAYDPLQIKSWLNLIWVTLLPLFVGLGNFLPEPAASDCPAQRRWLPLAFYFTWVSVTACHFGGIGYSNSFDWRLPLAVPAAWAASWTLFLRRKDIVRNPAQRLDQALLFIPLLVPLVAADETWIFTSIAFLNVICFGIRFIFCDRTPVALVQLLGAATIFAGGLPMAWLNSGLPRPEWILVCALLCFAWLMFLSRDPRVTLVSVLCMGVVSSIVQPASSLLAIQIGLVLMLAHSLRWEDHLHKGAGILRMVTGLLWVWLSVMWLNGSVPYVRLPIYIGAGALMAGYGISVVLQRRWQPISIPFFAGSVLLSEPVSDLAADLAHASPGFLAIAASFLLFAVGSLVAFSKSRNRRSTI